MCELKTNIYTHMHAHTHTHTHTHTAQNLLLIVVASYDAMGMTRKCGRLEGTLP